MICLYIKLQYIFRYIYLFNYICIYIYKQKLEKIFYRKRKSEFMIIDKRIQMARNGEKKILLIAIETKYEINDLNFNR